MPARFQSARQLIQAALSVDQVEDYLVNRDLFARALSAAAALGEPPSVQGRLQMRLAHCLYHLEAGDDGPAMALQAAESLERAGESTLASEALAMAGVCCMERGDVEQGLALLKRSLAMVQAAGDAPGQVRRLCNLVFLFAQLGDWHAATAASSEAVRICSTHELEARLADRAHGYAAYAHLQFADALQRLGRCQQSLEERQRAEAMLPALRSDTELPTLYPLVEVNSGLGRLAEARRAAIELVSRVRRTSMPSKAFVAEAWDTLATYHEHAGRPDKAVARLERAVRHMRQAGYVNSLYRVQGRLAHAHASAGRYAQALRWMRQARADRAELQPEQTRLFCHVAALEFDIEIRRAEQRRRLEQALQLAVVGRLMAEIYHALERPLAAVNETLGACAAEPHGVAPDVLGRLLRGVIGEIDQAASLTRQLKMFSYRAKPQPSSVDMPAALQEAWQGLAVGRSQSPAPFEMPLQGLVRDTVSVDAQRLAVLLRILLLESERMSGQSVPTARLRATPDTVQLDLSLSPGTAGQHTAPGVGFMLCEEIAREVNGELLYAALPDGGAVFTLSLPVG